MTDWIDDIRAAAINTGWKVRDIPKNLIEKTGFEKGVTITSPENDLTLEVMSSAEEMFCNFGNYGRFEVPISEDSNGKAYTALLNTLEDILKYGVAIETYIRGPKLLRSVVLTGPAEARRVVAKSVNGFGFFGGEKQIRLLGSPGKRIK